MKKRIFALSVLLVTAYEAWAVSDSPGLETRLYSVHDALALVLCNPEYMYSCSYGSQLNIFTYAYLALLFLTATFLYSRSFAYPPGFRTLSILRFGSARTYWIHTLRRNGRHTLLATALLASSYGIWCLLLSGTQANGVPPSVPYDNRAAVYVMYIAKLFVFLSLLASLAEILTGYLSHAGIIAGLLLSIAFPFFLDLFRKQTAILVIGSWQNEARALTGMIILQLLFIVYGGVRPLRLEKGRT